MVFMVVGWFGLRIGLKHRRSPDSVKGASNNPGANIDPL